MIPQSIILPVIKYVLLILGMYFLSLGLENRRRVKKAGKPIPSYLVKQLLVSALLLGTSLFVAGFCDPLLPYEVVQTRALTGLIVTLIGAITYVFTDEDRRHEFFGTILLIIGLGLLYICAFEILFLMSAV